MTGSFRFQQGSRAAALANGERLLSEKPAVAAMQARALLDADPQDRAALLLLVRAFDRQGCKDEAIAARNEVMRLTRQLPHVDGAFAALNSGHLDEALKLAESHLAREPDEPLGLLVAGEASVRLGLRRKGGVFLDRAIAAAPGLIPAHLSRARLHYEGFNPAAALAALAPLIRSGSLPIEAKRFHAGLLGEAGDYIGAERAFADIAASQPQEGTAQLDYGHALRTLGKAEEAKAAYRRAVDAARPNHAAWWGIASLGGALLDDTDIDCIASLGAAAPDPDLAVALHFALAKAIEARGDLGRAFVHYKKGNELRRNAMEWDASAFSARQKGIARECDAKFFKDRAVWGDPDPSPIFLVGMARSGSTLLEQALAGHAEIEGCGEMPAIAAILHEEAEDRGLNAESNIVAFLTSLSAEDCARLGGEYLARVAVRRRLGKRYFVDKLPHNWAELAFIKLILPKSTIIDLRRDPRDCCISNFAMLFAPGHPSSYGIGDWAAYYGTYRKFLRSLPVPVISLRYEGLVQDLEGELRRVLDAIGLPWDRACLNFADNVRAVATASTEQVRRPLNRSGLGTWQRFKPWLGGDLDILGSFPRQN